MTKILIGHASVCLLPLMSILSGVIVGIGVTKPCSAQGLEKQTLKFEARGFFSGRMKNGARFSLNLYTSPDGVGVSLRVEEHPSVKSATIALRERVEKAIEVLTKDSPSDHSGIESQRMVLLVPEDADYKEHREIIWRQGAVIYIIASISLEHAKELGCASDFRAMAMGHLRVRFRREVSGAGQDRAGPWDLKIVLRGFGSERGL